MSDYTQITNFTAKDALASGDPLKIIKGSDVDTEFAAIATAIATKANSASPTLTGTVTITGATLAGNATISGANTHSGANTFSGTVTMSGKSMYWAKGADIVSAATLVLGSDGNMFDVTGSTGPITAITVPAGMLFMLQFDSTPTLTHHATNLNLPGGANITVAAGDRAVCFATAANQVDVISISNLATQAKQEAGTDQVSSVTPATQQYHQSAAKVWGYATMSAGAPTLAVSYNVTSLTDTATGQLTITIATDFSSANWSCVPSIGVTAGTFQRMVVYDPLAAGSVLIRCTDTAADRDPDSWGWSFYGDQ